MVNSLQRSIRQKAFRKIWKRRAPQQWLAQSMGNMHAQCRIKSRLPIRQKRLFPSQNKSVQCPLAAYRCQRTGCNPSIKSASIFHQCQSLMRWRSRGRLVPVLSVANSWTCGCHAGKPHGKPKKHIVVFSLYATPRNIFNHLIVPLNCGKTCPAKRMVARNQKQSSKCRLRKVHAAGFVRDAINRPGLSRWFAMLGCET